jgi:D-serine dehydratase
MRSLAEKFIEGLKAEVQDQELMAANIETDAIAHDQIHAFAPYIARIRAQVAATRDLIHQMQSDEALK